MPATLFYGLGFSGEHIDSAALSRIQASQPLFRDSRDWGVRFYCPYANPDSPAWGVVLLTSFGEVPDGGTYLTMSDINTLAAPHKAIDAETQAIIEAELAKVDLAHLADKVEVVFYCR